MESDKHNPAGKGFDRADIHKLKLDQVEPLGDGRVRIGAMVSNTDLARHDHIRKHYPALSQALLSGASTQLRNKATTGGSLRT